MKIFTSRYCKAVVAFVAAMSLSLDAVAVSPQIVNSFYNYARTNQISKIRRLQNMGYNIDVKSDEGLSAYCMAKKNDDTYAMRLLAQMGADKDQNCGFAWGTAGAVALGVAAVGGGVALAAGGGGGGGGGGGEDPDPCASKPHSQWFVDHCECVPGYQEQSDGFCYKDLKCSEHPNTTGNQVGNQCVCATGYANDAQGLCSGCAADYVKGSDGVCYKDLKCNGKIGTTGAQDKDKCVCATGYVNDAQGLCSNCAADYVKGTDGVCYPKMSCNQDKGYGEQVNDKCVCKEGFSEPNCTACAENYIYTEGWCYLKLQCGTYGQQKGNTCTCFDNHAYDGTSCDNACVSGYELQDDGKCVKVLECGEHGESVGGQCVCDEGYAWDGTTCDNKCDNSHFMGDDGVCYDKLDCGAHGDQVNDQCVCHEGYDGPDCKSCAEGYYSQDESSGLCFKKLECGGGEQVGNACVCYPDYGLNGDGVCVKKTEDVVVLNDNRNYNDNPETVEYVNNEYADVYGMKYDPTTATDYKGDKNTLYNRYSEINSTGKVEQHSGISIINNSDSSVYGLYPDSVEAYNLYAVINADSEGTISALIDVENHGAGYAYGIFGKSHDVHNGDYISSIGDDFSTQLSSVINVTNDGSGSAIGITSSANVYNKHEWSVINVSNTYNRPDDPEDIHGAASGIGSMLGSVVNGGKITVSALSGDSLGIMAGLNVTNSGEITVTSDSGKASGVTGSEVDNSGSITVTSNSGEAHGMTVQMSRTSGAVGTGSNSSTITVSGGTDVYGMYLQSGASLTNTAGGVITGESKGGNVYGMYVGNTTSASIVSNLGRIDLETQIGDVYGVYHLFAGTARTSTVLNGSSMSAGIISAYTANGDAYGLNVSLAQVQNDPQGSIIASSNKGNVYGIKADKSAITQSGTVRAVAAQGEVFGVDFAGSNGTLTNSGNIIAENKSNGVAYAVRNENGTLANSGNIQASGQGDVYGVSVLGGSFENKSNGKISVTGSGAGTLYGAYLAKNEDDIGVSGANESNALINVIGTGTGTGTAYGIYLYDDDSGFDKNNGTIHVENANADAYGVYSISDFTNGSGENKDAKIEVVSNGKGKAYGVYTDKTRSLSASNFGTIDVTALHGNAYGLYSTQFQGSNSGGGEIIVETKGIGNAYGIYSTGQSVLNDGSSSITVTASGTGDAYGIYSEGSEIKNEGTITVTGASTKNAYGIYASGGNVNNRGTINVNGSDGGIYGIYATDEATVTNRGTINLNGVACEEPCGGSATNGNYIVLAEGSTLVNASLMSVMSDFDFDAYGTSLRMAKGGVVEASGEVIGTAAVDASVVQGGFEDEYREEGAIKGQNIDVAAASQSAMFEASIEEGEDGAADIVMKRESFNNLSSASSIAAYLEQNYKAEKNEQLFDALKAAPNAASYRSAEAELLGYGLLPNFSWENMTVLRSLNNSLNKELFTTEGKERKMVGYDFLYQARDTKGTLTGYENYANTMYFMYDNEYENGLRSGLGMSITQFNSNYDDDSSRKEIMIQALLPVSYKAKNGLKWASVARFGYGDGEYKRRTSSDVFESDLSEWIYGLSNAVRYEMDLGFVKVEPTAEFNVLGYYQNRIREDKNKANAIKADAVNNLSVEGGLGFNLSKEWKLNERDKLSVHAGAMYYHEFAEPYHSLDASIYGMTGSYRITDYEGIYDDDRGVLSAGFDYDIGDFTIYGQYNQYIEDENPMSINAGLKYRF